MLVNFFSRPRYRTVGSIAAEQHNFSTPAANPLLACNNTATGITIYYRKTSAMLPTINTQR
jgi:hypothetical protein